MASRRNVGDATRRMTEKMAWSIETYRTVATVSGGRPRRRAGGSLVGRRLDTGAERLGEADGGVGIEVRVLEQRRSSAVVVAAEGELLSRTA